MSLEWIRWLSVLRHLRWRLGLWSPLAGRAHQAEEVVLQTLPESAAPVSDSPQPVAEPVFGFDTLVSELRPPRSPDPFAKSLPEPAVVPQGMDEEPVDGLHQEEARLSNWSLVLIGIVVVLLSLGSFFI